MLCLHRGVRPKDLTSPLSFKYWLASLRLTSSNSSPVVMTLHLGMQHKNYLLLLETDLIQPNISHQVKRNLHFLPASVPRYDINGDKVTSSNIDDPTLRHTT